MLITKSASDDLQHWHEDDEFVAWVRTYFDKPEVEDEGKLEAMRDAYHAGKSKGLAAPTPEP